MSYSEATLGGEPPATSASAERADTTAALGIGALSKATGIPVETLRTWERRYGFPQADRDASGQRTYPLDAYPRLLLIRQALELGLRAARVVALPLGELERLLRETAAPAAQAVSTQLPAVQWRSPQKPEPQKPEPQKPEPQKPEPLPEPTPPQPLASTDSEEARLAKLERWLDMVLHYDGIGLAQEMARTWNHMGAVDFLDLLAGPFMAEIGRRWADGRLSVAHEHFATEQLRSQMNSMVGATSGAAPAVVCATLPGELHALGLQMAAVTAQLGGLRVIYLGADVPLVDLARAAEFAGRNGQLRGVVVSISRSVERQHARDQLSQLRSLLPAEIALLAGGAGAPSGVSEVQTLGSLRDFFAWTGQWRRAAGTAQ